MKFLQITNHFPPHFIGGDAQYCYQISNELSIRGHQVYVAYDKTSYDICSRQTNSKYEPMKKKPNLIVLPIQSKYFGEFFSISGACIFFNPIFYSNLKKLTLENRFDLIHLHNISWIGFTPFFVPELANIPMVYTAHDYWLVCPKLDLMKRNGEFCQLNGNCTFCVPPSLSFRATIQQQTKVYSRMLKRLNTIICVSKFQAFVLSKHLPNVKFEILHNFIDTEKIRSLDEINDETVTNFNLEYGIGDGNKVILFVGKIIALKGIFILLRSFAEVSRLVSNCVICIVGQCSNFKEIIVLAKELGIEKKLRFLGKVSEETLLIAYKRADVLVLPSLWPEPCPLVLLEGMAAKKPIVASRIGGIPEIVEDGENGLLVTPGDVDNLADSLIELLCDPDKSKTMGIKGYEILNKKYDAKNHIRKLLQLYDESINR